MTKYSSLTWHKFSIQYQEWDCTQNKNAVQMKTVTDNVWNVEAIREAASGSVSWIINTIRRRISTGSRHQVVIVATVNKRISKHKESSSMGLRSSCS